MVGIVKEKNYLIVTLPPLPHSENERVYRYNLETGYLYGKRNTPLKNPPCGLAQIMRKCNTPQVQYLTQYIGNQVVCEYTSWTNLSRVVSYLQTIDRMLSIGYTFKGYGAELNNSVIDCVKQNFRSFTQWLQEKGDDHCCAKDFQNYLDEKIFMARLGREIDEHFTEEMVQILRWDNRVATSKHIRRYAYFLERGLYYAFNEIGSSRSCARLLSNMENYAQKLGIDEIPKGDFLKIYKQLSTTYERERERIDGEALQRWQMSKAKALSFEDEEFQVVIPTTREQFRDEGEQQSNCVYSMYLQRVLDERCFVVFIRKKSDMNKSWITCEVRKDNGRIVQYLAKYNNSPRDEISQVFYRKYQNHLLENWS